MISRIRSLPESLPSRGVRGPASPLELELDAAALIANWRALDRLSGTAKAGAAVKADAYGVGARRVSHHLAAAGCAAFYVAYSQEAAELAGVVPADQIAILHGPMDAADAQFIRERGWVPVLNSLEQIGLWREAGGGVADVMIDTGINRLGLSPADLADPAIGALKVRTIHSHLADADNAESPLNRQQLQRWQDARALFPGALGALANSAGITLGPDYHGDRTRPGLALYGGIACSALADVIGPVVRLTTVVMQVRALSAGDSVGYNATFTAPAPMRVGVVALGYADGYLRAWSGKGALRHCGAALPVLGRVSMDMVVVDLGKAPSLRAGDRVEVVYDLCDAAQQTGLSQYELLTVLGRRFRRD